MFTSPHPYIKINHRKKEKEGFIEHVYSFRGKTQKRYLVIAEEYEFFVFIVKFCLQEKKDHGDRFNHFTKLNECSRVVTTVVSIMKELHSKNPFASFGFIGSHSPGEAKNNTKRFKLYSRIVGQIISPVVFEHKTSPKKSAYLLLNKDCQEQDLLDKIYEMFKRIYPELE